ncbi:conserved hypothetical protein [Talaromyces stipitatus ATCC 10500]|uniref:Uncharacterized protein n=1 Tax=Talaromyces stipitatus (strain ATCC 10500 / CBS 375.48 / QM 6759 / NRRL 1006) TaxID=441959 RepID=B8LUD6_TALSN|nr:uncharacterized protein TSTA_071120 [Talaromyces stipitatus ATCC 10500]EED23709.1 conserved hypothetical protein [Talaromyces stipitatus ATCC 10500]
MANGIISLLNWGNIKSLLLFFGPILLLRIINYYRAFRVQLAHRPPPRPILTEANRALNLLFGVIVVFLILSVPSNPYAPPPNIFTQTGSRINTPTDIIFARLARHRPDNELTDYDKLLRGNLTSIAQKKIYLRFGPEALLSCQFCNPEDPFSYLLFYLPLNTLVPHLIHLLTLGVVTSAPFAGTEAARWRSWFTFAALGLAGLDCYIMSSYDPIAAASPAVRAGQVPPLSLFTTMNMIRFLSLTVFDVVCAALIYISATHRFFYSPPSPNEQINHVIAAATAALNSANSKLHSLSVTRNAVVRDPSLKARDDWYWRAAVAMEGSSDANSSGDGSIWEEEEVVRAMSRVMNGRGRSRGLDMAQLGINAGEFVDKITAGLESGASL